MTEQTRCETWSLRSLVFGATLLAITFVALRAAPAAERDLFVGSYEGDTVFRFDGETGAFLGVADNFVSDNVFGVAFGNDGSLYVGDFARVLRFDSETAAFLSLLFQGSGICSDLVYRSDHRLYVRMIGASRSIVVLNGLTGAVIDEVLSSDAERFAIGPDGNLYVFSESQPEIWKFDSQTGDFLQTFASGPLPFDPGSIEFGPDGDLYVGDFSDSEVYAVRRYAFPSGAYLGVFATPDIGGGYGLLQFGPDGNL